MFRRRFESAIRRPGVDPATFATELGILAVWGFGDMGKRTHDSMIRDRFISAQRNCGLRRHLDGVSSDTPIRDIVDSCRVWESHSDLEPSSDAGRGQDSLGESDDSRKVGCLRTELQELLACSGMYSRVPVSVVIVGSKSVETPRKVGKGDGRWSHDYYKRHRRVGGWTRRPLRRGSWVHYQPCRRDLHGKRPLGEGVGEGMFLGWTPGTWREPMFTSGHFFSVSATGVVGGCPKWGLLRETRDGPGGRVSLPDHRRSRYD